MKKKKSVEEGWGENEKQKTMCPCDHVAVLWKLSFDCSESEKLLEHVGRNGREVESIMKDGERGAREELYI